MVPETQGQYRCQAVCSICHTMYTVRMTGKEVGLLCQCGSFVMFCAPNAKILTKYEKSSEKSGNPQITNHLIHHDSGEEPWAMPFEKERIHCCLDRESRCGCFQSFGGHRAYFICFALFVSEALSV